MTGLTWYQCLRCGRREEGGGYRCQCGARREVIPNPFGEEPVFSATHEYDDGPVVLAGLEAHFRRYIEGEPAFALPPEYAKYGPNGS